MESGLIESFESKLTCSKCNEIKHKSQFDERYLLHLVIVEKNKTLAMIYDTFDTALGYGDKGDEKHYEEILPIVLKPVCNSCFNEDDKKLIEQYKDLCEPYEFGFYKCSRCGEWRHNDFFPEHPERFEPYEACKFCLGSEDKILNVKQCDRCKKYKEGNQFEYDPTSNDNLFYVCNDCFTENDKFELRRRVNPPEAIFKNIAIIVGGITLFMIGGSIIEKTWWAAPIIIIVGLKLWQIIKRKYYGYY